MGEAGEVDVEVDIYHDKEWIDGLLEQEKIPKHLVSSLATAIRLRRNMVSSLRGVNGPVEKNDPIFEKVREIQVGAIAVGDEEMRQRATDLEQEHEGKVKLSHQGNINWWLRYQADLGVEVVGVEYRKIENEGKLNAGSAFEALANSYTSVNKVCMLAEDRVPLFGGQVLERFVVASKEVGEEVSKK